MAIFDSITLQRFYYEAENHLSKEHPFLVDRYSLNISVGIHTYTLPDYVVSIKRVTFLGAKLDPLPKRDLNRTFQSATQAGKPFWYIFNNIGQNKIRLFPTPNVSVATVEDLWEIGIATGCIVEFYRASDNLNFIVPLYLRRQLLKQFVARKCFSIEGAGTNIKMRDYFNGKWELKKVEFFSFLDEIHNKPRKLLISDIVGSNYFPASPVLPINRFGISVDEGY